MQPLLTSSLLLALCGMAGAQTVPAGWNIIKDAKGVCQASIPPDWTPATQPGMAKTKDTGTVLVPSGMVVVSSDVDRLQPMPEFLQKSLVDQMIENTDKRVFYSEKASASSQNRLYHATVPGKDGKGRCHATVTFQPSKVKDEIAKQIALSIGPVK
ncbi:MAG: hypothetical protein ABSB88_26925 [Bryobacteraceae bacterium]|jgi:hypothetical protein